MDNTLKDLHCGDEIEKDEKIAVAACTMQSLLV
jgi:hypothetical protein